MHIPDGGFENALEVIGVPVVGAGKKYINFGFKKRPVLNVRKFKAVIAGEINAIPADLVVVTLMIIKGGDSLPLMQVVEGWNLL